MTPGFRQDKIELIIAGHGGQGILFAGTVLSQAALEEEKNVTYFPAYGAEVRGGACYCMVVISENRISSPIVGKADLVIAMNRVSAEKFSGRVKTGGVIALNSSLVTKKDLIPSIGNQSLNFWEIPVTGLAQTLGDERLANIVMLGACLKRFGFLKEENLYRAIEVILQDRSQWIDLNKKAVTEGIKYDDQKQTIHTASKS